MASEERKALEIGLKPLMNELGYKTRGPTWHRYTSNVIQVLNIQGSQWSKDFHVNLGVYFREIGTEDKPGEIDCHIRQRLCAVVDDRQSYNRTLSFDSGIDLVERVRELRRLVSEFAIPWLEKCSGIEGARNYLLHEEKSAFPVLEVTWEYLGIE